MAEIKGTPFHSFQSIPIKDLPSGAFPAIPALCGKNLMEVFYGEKEGAGRNKTNGAV
jgi:hypothetical protein